ncbi:ArsR family transcriptional regulator, partial [Bacillus thuringiensis]
MYMYQINKVNVSSVFKNLKSFYFYMKVLIEGFKNFGNRSYKNGIHIKGECLMTTYT